MSEEPATVLGDVSCERRRATVILRVHTDRGLIALRFTPATAQIAGTALRLKAVRPVGELTTDPHAPVEKPGGGIL